MISLCHYIKRLKITFQWINADYWAIYSNIFITYNIIDNIVHIVLEFGGERGVGGKVIVSTVISKVLEREVDVMEVGREGMH